MRPSDIGRKGVSFFLEHGDGEEADRTKKPLIKSKHFSIEFNLNNPDRIQTITSLVEDSSLRSSVFTQIDFGQNVRISQSLTMHNPDGGKFEQVVDIDPADPSVVKVFFRENGGNETLFLSLDVEDNQIEKIHAEAGEIRWNDESHTLDVMTKQGAKRILPSDELLTSMVIAVFDFKAINLNSPVS